VLCGASAICRAAKADALGRQPVQGNRSVRDGERWFGSARRIDVVTTAPFRRYERRPIHLDPRVVTTFAPLFIAAAAVAVGLMLRSVVDRFLAEDHPRHFCIAQAPLYDGTFVIIAVSVCLRHR